MGEKVSDQVDYGEPNLESNSSEVNSTPGAPGVSDSRGRDASTSGDVLKGVYDTPIADATEDSRSAL